MVAINFGLLIIAIALLVTVVKMRKDFKSSGNVGILPDHEIRRLIRTRGLLENSVNRLVSNAKTPVISYGLSSFGYDCRLSGKVRLFTSKDDRVIDPKSINIDDVSTEYDIEEGEAIIVPPGGLLLGHTVEVFNMPPDLMSICLGKSTYARSGIHVLTTPIEPGFSGQVVIEITNCTNSPAKVYPYEGIAQFVFFRGERPDVNYADRDGKYQGQMGIVPSRI